MDSISVIQPNANRRALAKMSGEEFRFLRPASAPIFYPTKEEFADPLQYIKKIYPKAVNIGICKIVPPSDWTPPFSVNMDEFTFTPRVQKLNELGATTRIRMNFMSHILKFWEIHGTPLSIPVIEGKQVDLYLLHHLVNSSEFKNSKISEDRKWELIASRMGLRTEGQQTYTNSGYELKMCFERILRPYDIWKSTLSKSVLKSRKPRKGTVRSNMRYRSKVRPHLISNDCRICSQNSQNELLKCSDCHLKYHASCLQLSHDIICEDTWRCADCVSDKLKDLNEEYGFEQAVKEYTLQDFQKMANEFKSKYFKGEPDNVSSEELEQEFWRIISTLGENVVVEYGADVQGTGFPMEKTSNDELAPYVESGWNLNNLPVRRGSAFSHIKSEISGMKSPWVYVGMCFSTFCWHNEDHWSYSISYLHRGATKTWYGVPGGKAAEFEQAMRNAASELFETAPDLLHRLVTLVNPNELMKAKIPIHRMDQNAGEFIITFPRSYHAGFNQGFNFAEAVNFAPADWIPMGRLCVQNYAMLNRVCVFSHDELICDMAKEPEMMDYHLATATYNELLEVLIAEKKLRIETIQRGAIKTSERLKFEKIADDQRQCDVCKTTLFLSGVTCSHSKGSSLIEKFVCLNHFDQYMCKDCKIDPTKHILKYRYTLEELLDILKNLKQRLELYEIQVKYASLKRSKTKLSLDELRAFIEEMEQSCNPETPSKQETVSLEDPSRSVVSLRARKNNFQLPDTKFKLNVGEFRNIPKLEEYDIISVVPFKDFTCTMNQIEDLKILAKRADSWEKEVSEIFTKSVKTSEGRLKYLIREAESTITVFLPSLVRLQNTLKDVTAWKDRVAKTRKPTNDLYLHDTADLIVLGNALPVKLDLLVTITKSSAIAVKWQRTCSKEFLHPTSSHNFVEVLVPRVSAVNWKPTFPLLVSKSTNLSLEEMKHTDKLMTAIEKSMNDEASFIKHLRCSKLQSSSTFSYCCKAPFDASSMIQCQLCLDWFHPECVITKTKSDDIDVSQPGSVDPQRDDYLRSCIYELVPGSLKYLGPCCVRSLRPAKEKIEELISEMFQILKESTECVTPLEVYYLLQITNRLTAAFTSWENYKKSLEYAILFQETNEKNTEHSPVIFNLIMRGWTVLEDLMITIALLPVKAYDEKYKDFWDLYFSAKDLIFPEITSQQNQKAFLLPKPMNVQDNSSTELTADPNDTSYTQATVRKRKQSSCSKMDPSDDERCFMFRTHKTAKIVHTDEKVFV